MSEDRLQRQDPLGIRVSGPGVTIIPPLVDETRVAGVPVGVPAFLGYARRRGAGPWPVRLTAEDEIATTLEVPAWGHLGLALRSFFRNGGREAWAVGIPEDQAMVATTLLGGGMPGDRRGLAAVDAAGRAELVVLPDLYCVPDGVAPPALDAVIDATRAVLGFSAGLGRRSQGGYFAVLDAPPGLTDAQALAFAAAVRAGGAAEFGALYHPWLRVEDGAGGLRRAPPGGAIAGAISARSPAAGDEVGPTAGPHLVPANLPLADAIGAEREVSRAASLRLLDGGINAIVPWPGKGMVPWGARTLSVDPTRDHMTVRRILSYIRRSLTAGTQWAVFEPNTPTLWLRLRAYVSDFMERLWRAGLLVGTRAEEAYMVRCDASLNPPREVDAGRLSLAVAVRPARSLEQIVVRILHESARSTSAIKGE